MVAEIDHHTFTFNEPDWSAISQTIWRFYQKQDNIIKLCDLHKRHFTSIIYKVMKYDLVTNHVNENYGFAVQPLLIMYRDK